MSNTSIYQNIAGRTGGDIYLGVVGPVRTGKSTFIKRFMDLMVLSRMEDSNEKSRTVDELPQSAQGKTIMTTEPKFVPKDAVEILLEENLPVRIRLIDCVGYLIDGVNGHMEENHERMVKTPWYDYEIPFAKAAMIGTEKVIRDHSTIGVVVTTDGSFTDIPRENYLPAEERTIHELKKIGKPFVVLMNTPKPYSAQTDALIAELSEKYQVPVLPVNCEQMKIEDIQKILQQVLYEFPVTRMEFFLPGWVEMLDLAHPLKSAVAEEAGNMLRAAGQMRDVVGLAWEPEHDELTAVETVRIDLSEGSARFLMRIKEELYYQNLSELTGTAIRDEYEMISLIREMAEQKQKYERVGAAVDSVRSTGYGVVPPSVREISIDEPVLMKHGNKFGVKVKASSPSIHMIRANIETEIAPIIGSEEQAQDLIQYIKENQDDADGLWKTNIFGKSIGELVEDGIRRKITMMDEESQLKLQDTMQKIVNDSNGGLVCIII
ncbi:MAG: stage IV sporulation protein A [Clostridiales bacterium]|nr:stage IV sporulation protein A [Clostridiales bacterium]MCD8134168.1 stage IV sporulation protein A [Clostridiales bacterium]